MCATGRGWGAPALCVTPHWGWTRGRVRERICRDLESCLDLRASSPWCSGPDISGSRRRACLVWGSCSAPHGKGRAEHPMLVRSCRVPTEPALPWQGNLALPGRLHQDDPRGATSIPEQSRKGPASPALYNTSCSPSKLSVLLLIIIIIIIRSFPGWGTLPVAPALSPSATSPAWEISTSPSWAQGLVNIDKATCAWSLRLGLWQGRHQL